MNRASKLANAFSGLLAAATALVAIPAFADGDCQRWGVPETLLVTQGNQRLTFKLTEEGANFHGWAYYPSTKGWVKGNVSGSVTDNTFYARVLWTYSGVNAIGRYSGKITPRQLVPVGEITYGTVNEGYTYDEYDTSNYAYWNATDFICRDADDMPPPQPTRSTDPQFAEEKKHNAALSALAAEESASGQSVTMAVDRVHPAATAPPPQPPLAAEYLDELAAKGGPIVAADPLLSALRAHQIDAGHRGFDIGVAAAGQDTLPGPGKQHIHASLARAERPGYDAAVSFSLERNRNMDLASKGAAIDAADPSVAEARDADGNVFYRLGFDIATGMFGDPALGALGHTATGPGSTKLRDSLGADGQRGFDAAVVFHLARDYKH